ncbi:hypothetical protein [Lentzea atacamensis]|nr:hypothetical protein [Lentzea atacamensis]
MFDELVADLAETGPAEEEPGGDPPEPPERPKPPHQEADPE